MSDIRWSCPECGADDLEPMEDADSQYQGDPGAEPESRCRNCGYIAHDSVFQVTGPRR